MLDRLCVNACGEERRLVPWPQAVAISSAACWFLPDQFTHPPYSKAYFIYREMFMRLLSFLTTSMTLSKIHCLVLNKERMIAELLETRNKLVKYNGTDA